MKVEIKKSKRLIRFLEKKGLQEKFDLEVRKWNPKSYQNKKYDSIIGSFRFSSTVDGAIFWQELNDEFEGYIVNTQFIQNTGIPAENG